MNEMVETRPPVIETRNVSKIFNQGTPREYKALENLNFCIEDLPGCGEFITILGPSGCGKSTALNLLAGFQEVWPPTTGEIKVRGMPVKGPGMDRGMVFQKYSSFPHLTVRKNVRFGMELNRQRLNLSEEEIEDRAMEWIEKIGLRPHAEKYPHQLSGGQQQRVALARTLVCKPRIILMDEPFSALDEPTRLDMQQLVVDLWQAVEATVLLVTHSVVEAVFLGDRVWIFSQAPGRIAREITQVPAAVPGEPPLVLQQKREFLDAVERVSAVFHRIEQGEPVSE